MDTEALHDIYARQAAWFAGERSRILRKIDIRRMKCVLDLGCGTGSALAELQRRAAGRAVGIDRDPAALRQADGVTVAGDAVRLPFADATFDLVFSQMVFLWLQNVEAAIDEAIRVLRPGSYLVAAAEPDYGGVVSHPEDDANLRQFVAGLEAEGANVRIGRALGQVLERAGLVVECGTHPARPMDAAKGTGVFAIPELVAPDAATEFLYIPYFWYVARRV